MGCNGSKSEDVAASQPERKKPSQAAKTPSKAREPDQEAIDREIENKLATQRSATDARDSQAERLKDIVERTSLNLIDVSLAATASSQLADQDAEARKKKYPANIGKTKIAKVSTFTLPASSVPITPTLFAVGLPPADREIAEKASASLSSAVSRVAMASVGDLVVTFPSVMT